MFDGWGRFVFAHRGKVLLASGLLLVVSLAVLAQGGELQSFQLPENTESGEAAKLLEEQLGGEDASFVVVLSHPTMRWDDTAFESSARAALAGLETDERVASITTPYSAPQAAGALVSRDGHRILAIVALDMEVTKARDEFPSMREKLSSSALGIQTTSSVAIYSDVQTILDEDLKKAETVGLPLSLILLLVVFGTVVAALLPLGVGVLAVMGGLAGVFFASRLTDMSVYAMNIVTLIGLGVAIDYSLFMVTRFREELAHGRSTEDALAETMATAGRATTFSGLTVAIGLGGLAFYQGLYFASIGMAGAIVVGLAVLYALTFLPALLAYLGPRINKGRIPFVPSHDRGRFWERLARGVMRRPVLVLVPTLALVLVAGSPFLGLQMGSAGVEILPEDAESREAYEVMRAEFPNAGRNEMSVVVAYPGDPLTRDRVGALHDWTRTLDDIPHVTGVQSIVHLDPRLDKAQYQDIYSSPPAQRPEGMQEVVESTVGESIVLVRVQTDTGETSPEARAIVDAIRALPPPADARVLVTGTTAMDADTIELVYRYTPAAVLFVVITTYLLLLLQTGSVVLPAKAIVMNFLSIAASFGALVWVFQEGNLSALLHFTPAPLDPSLPVLLFCIVFGLSMDYEVLLLSRMHEEWDRTGDNTAAVAGGLAKSGRLITSAAGIMVVVFGAFAIAQVTIIKAIGLGLALAIAIDATLVRALVVPASMRLMGRFNWWAPAWVTRLTRPFQH